MGTDGETFPSQFGLTCLESTECFPLTERVVQPDLVWEQLIRQFDIVLRDLLGHCGDTRTKSSVNSRHDTVFGMSLFASALVAEIMQIGALFILRTSEA